MNVEESTFCPRLILPHWSWLETKTIPDSVARLWIIYTCTYLLTYLPFITWTMFTQMFAYFMFTMFVSVVFCYANTIEMSDNVNGCLLIRIQQLFMFITLHLCGLIECM